MKYGLFIRLFLFQAVVGFLVCGNPEPETEVEAAAETEPEGRVETEPEPEPEGVGETEPEPEGGGETETEPEGTGETEAECEPKVTGESEPEGESESESEPQSCGESEAAAEEETAESEESEPQAENSNVVEMTVFILLYALCIIFIVGGNSIIAVTIMKTSALRTITPNVFLFSLVSARVLIGLFVVPARIAGMFSEEALGSTFCRLCHYCGGTSVAASLFSIVAIALSKYYAVTRLDGVLRAPFKTNLAMIVLIWFLALLYAVRQPVTYDLIVIDAAGSLMWSCTTSPMYKSTLKYFIIIDFLILFIIPFIIILFCYVRVIQKLKTDALQKFDQSQQEEKRKATIKAIKMLIVLMILFSICTSLPLCLKIYILWGPGYFANVNVVEAAVYLFSYSNGWYNVIVFIIFRDDIRKAFKSLVDKSCCRKSQKVTPVESLKDSMGNETGNEKINNMLIVEF